MLVRPNQQEGESLAGFQWRLARANGLSRPVWLAGTLLLKPHARRRICPDCLASPTGIWRSDWEHGLPLCAVHRAWLLDRCPVCGSQFTLAKLRSQGCKCGTEFGAMRQLCKLDSPEHETLPKHLSQEGCMWLGAIDGYGLQGRPGKKLQSQEVAIQADLILRGARIARNCPQAFYSLLDRVRVDAADHKAVSLLNGALPGLVMQIRRIQDAQLQSKVSLALQGYVEASVQTARPIVGRNVSSPATLKQVSASVGIGIKRARSLLSSRQDRRTRVTKAGRIREVTTGGVLGQELTRAANSMSLTAARRQLGMSMARIRELCAVRGIPIKAGKVEARLVTRLRDQILARQISSTVAPGTLISWSEALRMHVTVDRTDAWVNAVIAGEVGVFGAAGAACVTECRFDLHEVLAWVSRRSAPLDSSMLSLVDAAGHLGVKQEVIYHLVRAGHLRVVEGKRHRRAAQFVEWSELDRFNSQYQSLAAFARARGTSARSALALLEAKGIPPVVGPTVDGCRQYFFQRSV